MERISIYSLALYLYIKKGKLGVWRFFLDHNIWDTLKFEIHAWSSLRKFEVTDFLRLLWEVTH